MHPQTVVYLEHDGKLLLVNEEGHGPQDCIMGRQDVPASLRFPTKTFFRRRDFFSENIKFGFVFTAKLEQLDNQVEWPIALK